MIFKNRPLGSPFNYYFISLIQESRAPWKLHWLFELLLESPLRMKEDPL
jgi:hypothetical protein